MPVMKKAKQLVSKVAKKAKKTTKKVAQKVGKKKATKKVTKKTTRTPSKRRPLEKNEVPTANDGDEGGPGAPSSVEELLTRDDSLDFEVPRGPETYSGSVAGFHDVEVEDEDEF